MKTDDLQNGTVVARSMTKTLKRVALGAFLEVIGLGVLGGGLYAMGAARGLWGVPPTESKTLILLGGGAVALIGLALCALAGYLAIANLIYLFRKERYVVGKRYLYWILDAETVRSRLPFDNISSIRLKTHTDENTTFRYIAIQLGDVDRKDTIVDPRALKHSQDGHDCEVAIFDEYELPLEKLYRMIRGKCKAALD